MLSMQEFLMSDQLNVNVLYQSVSRILDDLDTHVLAERKQASSSNASFTSYATCIHVHNTRRVYI